MTPQEIIDKGYDVFQLRDGEYWQMSRRTKDGKLIKDANYESLVKMAFEAGYPMYRFELPAVGGAAYLHIMRNVGFKGKLDFNI